MKPRKAGLHLIAAANPYPSQADNTERLQVAGLLAAGVAHDFNNLLGVILGCCGELTAQSGLAEPVRALIAEIEIAGNAARQMTQSLLGARKGDQCSAVLVDVNESVRRMSPGLQRMAGERVVCQHQLGQGLGVVEMHPGEFEQILMNLAINGCDAMPLGGTLAIETSQVYLDDAAAQQHPGTWPGDYVRLTVSDTGAGMDAQVQARMFEPFFTTKPVGQGTGIGLSSVAHIVRNRGGAIAVHSRPGCGTTFRIDLPAGRPATHGLPLPTGSGTVLLVEDMAPLRALTRRILEEAGYNVLDAGAAEDALCLAQACAEPICLLITDVMMPGTSGMDLARRLTALRPQMKVLFMTGHGAGGPREDCWPRVAHALLKKPFTRELLLTTAGQLLHPAERIAGFAKFPPPSAADNHRFPRKAPLACS